MKHSLYLCSEVGMLNPRGKKMCSEDPQPKLADELTPSFNLKTRVNLKCLKLASSERCNTEEDCCKLVFEDRWHAIKWCLLTSEFSLWEENGVLGPNQRHWKNMQLRWKRHAPESTSSCTTTWNELEGEHHLQPTFTFCEVKSATI